MKPYYKCVPPLSPEEVDAISKYQDLQSKYAPRSDWDFNFPQSKTTGRYSFMINNYYRGRISPTKGDVITIEYYANLINSAIHRFVSTKPMTLYRGYTDPSQMISYVNRDSKTKTMTARAFAEPSFISSTDSPDMAWYYATKNPEIEHPIVSICTYPPKTPMLYLDDKEHEWLLPPAKFKIISLAVKKKEGKEGIVYYISKI